MSKRFNALLCVFLAFRFLAQGSITLTFDDGYSSHYDTVLPLLEQYEISATFYITPSLLEEPGYLTKKQVIQISQKGHEIASHSLTHRNLQKLRPIEIEKELLESKRKLEELIQSPVVSFAPPFGTFHSHLIYLLRKYYESSRSIFPGLNEKGRVPSFLIRAQVVFHLTPLSEVQKWINLAKEENKWLVLVYHQIDDSKGIVSVDPFTFETHLKMIQNSCSVCSTVKNRQ